MINMPKKAKKKPASRKSKKPETKPQTIAQNKTQSTIIILLFFIIFILGTHFRIHQYGIEGGLSYDTFMLIAGGVLWFHPHDFFPGLVQMYPPVAHQIIGYGCMQSGADFSDSSKLRPNYLINIPALIGKSFTEAENYCILPNYIAAILLFIGLIALGLSLLDKKSALYHAAFYAFLPVIIWWGRTIYIDVFVWLFTVYGLLFLWLSYKSKLGSKIEIICAIIAFGLFGLALATKLTAGIYLPFAILIILEKYKNKMNFSKGNAKVPVPLIKTLIAAIISFTIITMAPYQFNPKNLIDVYTMHSQWHSNETSFSITTNGLEFLYDIMYRINSIDIIIFLLSFYILIKIIQKKNKKPNEKYILYLYLLGLFTITTSGALGPTLGRRTMLFFFGVPLMMSLIFSNESYSIIKYMERKKITQKTINSCFIILMITYIIHASSILQPISPHYLIYSNPVMCNIDNGTHCTHNYKPIWKTIATQLNTTLAENETFYDADNRVSIYMYLRHEDGYIIWQIKQSYKSQTGRDITTKELKHYFNYNGRKIRYLVIHSLENRKGDIAEIVENYTPDHIVKIKNHPVSYIYDLDKIYPEKSTE